MTRVLILGAYGLLGSTLSRRLLASGHSVVRQGRRECAELRLDPTDQAAMRGAVRLVAPEVVINLVAATNVDQCEAEPQAAYLANVRPVEVLTEVLGPPLGRTSHLIQVSTDQVYDGPGPHREADANPCNVYALSKYAGELAACAAGATVLRTNLFGRSRAPGRASLSDWLVQSLRGGTRITVFDDVLFSAVHLDTLCEVIAIATQRRPTGVFNAGCRDGISKAGFAFRLAEKLDLDRSLMTIGRSSSAELRARRPLDMRMDPTKFEHAFEQPAPTIESQIDLAAKEYRHDQA